MQNRRNPGTRWKGEEVTDTVSATNNFITDLLDEMIVLKAKKLLCISNSQPSLMINGIFRNSAFTAPVNVDELMFDLESLGITISQDAGDKAGIMDWVYEPDGLGEIIELRLRYGYSGGNLTLQIEQKNLPFRA